MLKYEYHYLVYNVQGNIPAFVAYKYCVKLYNDVEQLLLLRENMLHHQEDLYMVKEKELEWTGRNLCHWISY